MLRLKTRFILCVLVIVTLLAGCMARPYPADAGQEADTGQSKESAVAASTDPLTIEVIPQFDPILEKAARELYVMVRLKAGGASGKQRPPLDLALVLDRSGSMSGQKLDDAKRAALDLLGQLNEKDRVTLVVYDNLVDVLEKRLPVDATGRESLRAQLLKVKAGDSTALGPLCPRS